MKKVIILFVALMMLLSACGQSEPEKSGKKSQKKDLYATGLEYKQDGDLENAQAAFLEAVGEDPDDVFPIWSWRTSIFGRRNTRQLGIFCIRDSRKQNLPA